MHDSIFHFQNTHQHWLLGYQMYRGIVHLACPLKAPYLISVIANLFNIMSGIMKCVNYVTSSYSTWIFCRGVSGFATDCPCGIWCRGSTTCLLYVGPLFWKSTFEQQLGCRFDIMVCKSSIFLYFDICNRICLDSSYAFSTLSLLLK